MSGLGNISGFGRIASRIRALGLPGGAHCFNKVKIAIAFGFPVRTRVTTQINVQIPNVGSFRVRPQVISQLKVNLNNIVTSYEYSGILSGAPNNAPAARRNFYAFKPLPALLMKNFRLTKDEKIFVRYIVSRLPQTLYGKFAVRSEISLDKAKMFLRKVAYEDRDFPTDDPRFQELKLLINPAGE